MPSNKGELPETFPSKLLEDLDQLQERYGPKALHTALQYRRHAIKGHPRKRSPALLEGVWRLVEMVKFLLEVDNTKRVCQLLAKHAIIDEMNETCAFASGAKKYLDAHRKPPETWRRLYVQGQHQVRADEQKAWRERLRVMPTDPRFLVELAGSYRALPKRSSTGTGLSEVKIERP
jgi:hypothetical protein